MTTVTVLASLISRVDKNAQGCYTVFTLVRELKVSPSCRNIEDVRVGCNAVLYLRRRFEGEKDKRIFQGKLPEREVPFDLEVFRVIPNPSPTELYRALKGQLQEQEIAPVSDENELVA